MRGSHEAEREREKEQKQDSKKTSKHQMDLKTMYDEYTIQRLIINLPK